jgi:hypothetical protein
MDGGFDYVTPLYRRHKYDGTITNSIIYPMTRALYGKRIRQPIGGDFGFSGRLAQFFLTKDVWGTDVARYGIDIWMTTTAVANNFRVCQAFLGAKIHDPKDPGADLSSMLFQVVGATFDLTEDYAAIWKAVEGSQEIPAFGFQYAVGLEPVSVNLERMVEKFRLGIRELLDLWRVFIPEHIVGFLKQAEDAPGNILHIPDEIWAEIIYSFALATHAKSLNKEHLLKSLTPLYIGKVASFVAETHECSADEVEEKIDALCMAFEKGKKIFIERWS